MCYVGMCVCPVGCGEKKKEEVGPGLKGKQRALAMCYVVRCFYCLGDGYRYHHDTTRWKKSRLRGTTTLARHFCKVSNHRIRTAFFCVY